MQQINLVYAGNNCDRREVNECFNIDDSSQWVVDLLDKIDLNNLSLEKLKEISINNSYEFRDCVSDSIVFDSLTDNTCIDLTWYDETDNTRCYMLGWNITHELMRHKNFDKISENIRTNVLPLMLQQIISIA